MTSPARISQQMKKIHSKDTKPELILRKALWAGSEIKKIMNS